MEFIYIDNMLDEIEKVSAAILGVEGGIVATEAIVSLYRVIRDFGFIRASKGILQYEHMFYLPLLYELFELEMEMMESSKSPMA